ncbi:hypothetical protein KM043_011202 [Ampulex compressa]|nr:hypothetical protein KM043_011202 [Ampulex compressa]
MNKCRVGLDKGAPETLYSQLNSPQPQIPSSPPHPQSALIRSKSKKTSIIIQRSMPKIPIFISRTIADFELPPRQPTPADLFLISGPVAPGFHAGPVRCSAAGHNGAIMQLNR